MGRYERTDRPQSPSRVEEDLTCHRVSKPVSELYTLALPTDLHDMQMLSSSPIIYTGTQLHRPSMHSVPFNHMHNTLSSYSKVATAREIDSGGPPFLKFQIIPVYHSPKSRTNN